jgi:hypothetical protein
VESQRGREDPRWRASRGRQAWWRPHQREADAGVGKGYIVTRLIALGIDLLPSNGYRSGLWNIDVSGERWIGG